MMMLRRTVVLPTVAALSLGCGRAKDSGKTESPPSATPGSEIGISTANQRIDRVVPPDTDGILRINGEDLRLAFEPTLRALEPAPGVGSKLRELEARCGFQPIEAVDELVVGFSMRSGEPAIAAFQVNQPRTALERCIRAMEEAESIELSEHSGLFLPKVGAYVVNLDGWVLAASSKKHAAEGVRRLKGTFPPGSPEWQARLSGLSHDTIGLDLITQGSAPFERVTLSVRFSGNTMDTETRITLNNEADAREAEGLLRDAAKNWTALEPRPSPVNEAVTQFLSELTVERRGLRVSARGVVHGPAGPAVLAALTSRAIEGLRSAGATRAAQVDPTPGRPPTPDESR